MTTVQYFKRFLGSLPAWSKASGYSVVRLALSFAVSRVLHGSNSEEFLALRLYKYTNRERSRFLLTRSTKRVSDRLTASATPEELALFDDKARFNARFADYIHREFLYLPEASEEEVSAFLSRNERFLAKACVSTQGKNIYLHKSGEIEPDALLREYEGMPFILETFLTQHPDMAALNPSTVNTVRILTIQKNGNVLIVGACLRCGGADAYVDNFHSGGVAYPIDIETGIISAPGRRLLEPETHLCHPSTGRVMPGFRIPHWDNLLEIVSQAAVVVPSVGYIGWDVAILPDGAALVEGNINYPDPIVVQLNERGVYPKVKAFLKGAAS